MVEMDFHPKPLKERIVTLERRGRGIQATETFTDEEGWILASAGPTGVTIAANGFKTREDAAQNLRALADALDGGQKRRHRKAKEE